MGINSMMWQNAGRSGIDQWNFVNSPENGSQDPTRAYVRKWIPELRRLPDRVLHKPWTAASDVLARAGVDLGRTYPRRIVSDLKAERRISVEMVLEMRRANQDRNFQGYDTITLPDGSTTRVFTKKEYRINADGTVMRQQSSTSSARRKRTQTDSRSNNRSRGPRQRQLKLSIGEKQLRMF